MSLFDDLFRPRGDRQPQPGPVPVPVPGARDFTLQQDFLTACRLELVTNQECQLQLRERQEQLVGELLGHSQVAPWDSLWPMVALARIIVPPENLAVIFGVGADGSGTAPATVQDAPPELLRGIYIFGVLTDFLALAQTDEARARQWHKDHPPCFPHPTTAPFAKIVAGAQHRHTQLQTYVHSQLLWLKADALSFFPEPGRPEKGWVDAYCFLWGFQRLPAALREEFNPCQLRIAHLPALPQTPPGDAKAGTDGGTPGN